MFLAKSGKVIGQFGHVYVLVLGEKSDFSHLSLGGFSPVFAALHHCSHTLLADPTS